MPVIFDMAMKPETEPFKDYKLLLESVGLKATHQRIVIFAALMQKKSHVSAEALYESLKSDNPSLSLGTVYRTLESFSQHGLIQRVNNREGKLLFDSNREVHHHLYDVKKHHFEDFEDAELDRLIQAYFEKNAIPGFVVKGFQLQIDGHFTD
jgi:Fur family peroxide stress response transcriptional regulator